MKILVSISYLVGTIFALLCLLLFDANAAINKDIYTKVNAEVQTVFKQYEADKEYLSNLIEIHLCKEKGFSATQIAVIQMNKNSEVLKDIANEVLGTEAKKFIKEVDTVLGTCNKKLIKIRDDAIENIIISYSIKYKMTIKQIKKAIKVRGIIV